MAWVISWENTNEGCCAAFRPSYEQEIGEGWKKHEQRIMDAQKKLRSMVKQVTAERDTALALLNEKDAALQATSSHKSDFTRSVERGKHLITEHTLTKVIKENQQLKATLVRITEERNRARLERDTLEQNRGCWTGRTCVACSGTGERDEMRNCPECGGTGETWETYEEQLKRAKADAAVLRHALDSVVCDFMPGPDSGCDSRGVEPSLVEGAAALSDVTTGQALLADIEVMYAALEELACLGNGKRHGSSIGNIIAQAAMRKLTTADGLVAVKTNVASRHQEGV